MGGGVLSTFEHPIVYLLITLYTQTHDYMCTHIALSNIIGSFKTSQYHPTSARISWEAVKEDDKTVTSYTVQVEGPDSTQEIPITCEYITSVEISDLRPSTQYTFKVSAVTVAGTKPQRGETSMHYA